MAPLLMLLLVLLAFSMAHAQTPAAFDVVVTNGLTYNDAECTIAAPELLNVGGTGEASVFVPAQSNRTLHLQASQSLTSPSLRMELFGPGPLGRGCRGCCSFFLPYGCRGKRYTVEGDFLLQTVSVLGFEIKIVRNCGTASQPKLFLEGYSTPAKMVKVLVASTCVPED